MDSQFSVQAFFKLEGISISKTSDSWVFPLMYTKLENTIDKHLEKLSAMTDNTEFASLNREYKKAVLYSAVSDGLFDFSLEEKMSAEEGKENQNKNFQGRIARWLQNFIPAAKRLDFYRQQTLEQRVRSFRLELRSKTQTYTETMGEQAIERTQKRCVLEAQKKGQSAMRCSCGSDHGYARG